MEGIIFDIKRFAVHDGPGIRTTVFLKGCPLKCSWCHNPESQGFGVETLSSHGEPLEVGRRVTVDQLVSEVERDVPFFDESGGGVTFSGGEPLSQPEFLVAALAACGREGLHRVVATSGYAPAGVLRDVANHTDLFLYDLKPGNGMTHEEHTGVSVDLIHDNLRMLCETDVAIRLRLPVIPGLTDARENLIAVQELVAALPRKLSLQLLPYHSAAMDKYRRFGLPVPLPDTQEPTTEQLQTIKTELQELGLEVIP